MRTNPLSLHMTQINETSICICSQGCFYHWHEEGIAACSLPPFIIHNTKKHIENLSRMVSQPAHLWNKWGIWRRTYVCDAVFNSTMIHNKMHGIAGRYTKCIWKLKWVGWRKREREREKDRDREHMLNKDWAWSQTSTLHSLLLSSATWEVTRALKIMREIY